ncbi:bifunctional phosphopantothenoylcysteine decarboxylase/phosphopantothenate--cysteine ligase CoaBC [Conexibacter stalactiti]|uniref:Coenzyme A biosynthesis bifunctional protein CoaBC n=1 Tax=Conexibacter stalactiti TaxID=1940611 RepID=A0ABU4HPF7_9ACTN|nr:bifunctional phosphopantothenoylcysteine decarboxylase/phosphopantothenate--cysteine ligase CoaBC [Conexibacter stalactiti]MDW5595187.1 bifunctional phosphopantothenoylcysteine decarboxylase/phosphopantothenate--cysteine ligase CoaBC [Conexibacter stalactiti]MEC5035829.1 bifunctional phosphopantothenoylcysteine decarboxylase/phosphopantothenate--cysteine ligase CoaBC [Conexibacter stalactiti]
MARILLGVSGGIAAYKALETIRLATKAGHSVRVVQTPTSERFVGAASFEAITGAPVLSSEFEPDPARGAFPGDAPPEHAPISHLALVGNADVFLIAPASANTLAKLAGGFADNLLTSAALAARCPLLVAPAMNDAMWEHAATRANVATLRQRGVHVIDPGHGQLASKGEFGAGRLAEPAELLAAVEAVLAKRADLAGLRILVTAGGTREPIDSVRFVGNRSSGRMGFALAEQAARRGAAVTVLAANVALERTPGVVYRDVETAAQLADACGEEFPRCDVLLMSAAVADFRPVAPPDAKIKKDAGPPPAIELEATPDILLALAAQRRPGQTVVGFAAEHGDGALDFARGKLARKRLDAIVVNDISQPGIGFDTPDNEVTIVAPDRERPLPRAPKGEIAAAILDEVVRLRTTATADGAADGTAGPAADRTARV